MDKVISGAIVLWACITLWFIGCDIVKGIRSKKNMAMYPTPMTASQEYREATKEIKSMQEWIRERYPQVFDEWKAVYDIERNIEL